MANRKARQDRWPDGHAIGCAHPDPALLIARGPHPLVRGARRPLAPTMAPGTARTNAMPSSVPRPSPGSPPPGVRGGAPQICRSGSGKPARSAARATRFWKCNSSSSACAPVGPPADQDHRGDENERPFQHDFPSGHPSSALTAELCRETPELTPHAPHDAPRICARRYWPFNRLLSRGPLVTPVCDTRFGCMQGLHRRLGNHCGRKTLPTACGRTGSCGLHHTAAARCRCHRFDTTPDGHTSGPGLRRGRRRRAIALSMPGSIPGSRMPCAACLSAPCVRNRRG